MKEAVFVEKKGLATNQVGHYTVSGAEIHLQCRCKKEKVIPRRPGEDVGDILDREAEGWWTAIGGICLCPKCNAEHGSSGQHLSAGTHPWRTGERRGVRAIPT